MPHSSTRRCGLPADETNNRFLHVLFDIGCRFFFCRSADLANHDNAMCIGIFVEETDSVDEVCADDRIAPDTDARGLADLALRQLSHSFIGQSSASGDHSDVPFQMNMSGHDADLASAW